MPAPGTWTSTGGTRPSPSRVSTPPSTATGTRPCGQFLLRWYGHSSHHQRFVVVAEGRIVLAAPPKRVSVRREDRMRVVAEIPAGTAVIEDPLPSHDNRKLRIRFMDGSWLMLTTEEQRSELHMHLMRQSRAGESGVSDV